MKKILLLMLSALSIQSFSQSPCIDGMAAGLYPCENVDLLSYMSLSELNSPENTNDIWGWVSPNTNIEYGLVGLSSGTAFVSLEDPLNPVLVGFLPTHTVNSLWRDVKVFNNYCFIVSEAPGHGLQIFDLTQLDEATSLPVTFEESAYYGGFGHSHNVLINEETGYCYAVGTDTFSGGLHIVDVNDPLNPVLAGGFSQDGYTHDAWVGIYNGPDADYIGKEIVVACNEDYLTVIDCTDKTDCMMISTINYPEVGYVHQGWYAKGFRYFLVGDELDEQHFTVGTRTHIVDLLDLDNPVYMGYEQSSNTSIDHNLYTLDQMVFESNYRSGLRIFDASRVGQTQLDQVGYFDLFPNNDLALFSGTWSNYAYFPSGVTIATSMYDGLFVLKPRIVEMPAEPINFCDNSGTMQITINGDLQFPLTVSSGDLTGQTAASAATIEGPGTYTITLSGTYVEGQDYILYLGTTFDTYYEYPFTIGECIVGVEEEHLETSGLNITPNPANEMVTLTHSNGGGSIEIYDITGKKVYSRNTASSIARIDISSFNAGLYIVKWNNEMKKLHVK